MAQINKPDLYFNTKLYTGNGGTNNITGVNFQPDLVWIKGRNVVANHRLVDAVRGTQQRLMSNATNAESTETGLVTSFDSDGFTLNSADAAFNGSGDTFVSWNWLASNTTASNTDGSITSTVSANTTSGFSIVSYTGNGTSSATVGHGLGVAPKMTIIKQRNSSNGWNVWHYGNNAGDPDSFGELNSTAAWYQDQGADGPYTTQPTSSLLTLTAYGQVNGNTNTYIAYCFAEKQGYSKFGSYTGNGNADGTFVYTGFKPAFVMVKKSAGTGSWAIQDNKRTPFNVQKKSLFANLSDVETDSTNDAIDVLSNGFKFRSDTANYNTSGDAYIYMAFAENPLVGTNNIPATAR